MYNTYANLLTKQKRRVSLTLENKQAFFVSLIGDVVVPVVKVSKKYDHHQIDPVFKLSHEDWPCYANQGDVVFVDDGTGTLSLVSHLYNDDEDSVWGNVDIVIRQTGEHLMAMADKARKGEITLSSYLSHITYYSEQAEKALHAFNWWRMIGLEKQNEYKELAMKALEKHNN